MSKTDPLSQELVKHLLSYWEYLERIEASEISGEAIALKIDEIVNWKDDVKFPGGKDPNVGKKGARKFMIVDRTTLLKWKNKGISHRISNDKKCIISFYLVHELDKEFFEWCKLASTEERTSEENKRKIEIENWPKYYQSWVQGKKCLNNGYLERKDYGQAKNLTPFGKENLSFALLKEGKNTLEKEVILRGPVFSLKNRETCKEFIASVKEFGSKSGKWKLKNKISDFTNKGWNIKQMGKIPFYFYLINDKDEEIARSCYFDDAETAEKTMLEAQKLIEDLVNPSLPKSDLPTPRGLHLFFREGKYHFVCNDREGEHILFSKEGFDNDEKQKATLWNIGLNLTSPKERQPEKDGKNFVSVFRQDGKELARTFSYSTENEVNEIIARLRKPEIQRLFITATLNKEPGLHTFVEDGKYYFICNDKNGNLLLYNREGFVNEDGRDTAIRKVKQRLTSKKSLVPEPEDDSYVLVIKGKDGKEIARSLPYSSPEEVQKIIDQLKSCDCFRQVVGEISRKKFLQWLGGALAVIAGGGGLWKFLNTTTIKCGGSGTVMDLLIFAVQKLRCKNIDLVFVNGDGSHFVKDFINKDVDVHFMSERLSKEILNKAIGTDEYQDVRLLEIMIAAGAPICFLKPKEKELNKLEFITQEQISKIVYGDSINVWGDLNEPGQWSSPLDTMFAKDSIKIVLPFSEKSNKPLSATYSLFERTFGPISNPEPIINKNKLIRSEGWYKLGHQNPGQKRISEIPEILSLPEYRNAFGVTRCCFNNSHWMSVNLSSNSPTPFADSLKIRYNDGRENASFADNQGLFAYVRLKDNKLLEKHEAIWQAIKYILENASGSFEKFDVIPLNKDCIEWQLLKFRESDVDLGAYKPDPWNEKRNNIIIYRIDPLPCRLPPIND